MQSDFLHTLYVKLGDMAVVILFINVIVLLINYKKLNVPFQLLAYFLLWNLLIEIGARICSYSGQNNLPLLHLYTLGEFLLLGLFYRSLLVRPKLLQQHFVSLLAGGAVLIILNSLFFQSIFGFNTIAKTSVQVVIIAFAVLYFYNLTENESGFGQPEKGLRLINSTIIVYYSGSLFVFMCSQISFAESDLYVYFWAFNAALNLSFQLLILWGIWKTLSRKTASSS